MRNLKEKLTRCTVVDTGIESTLLNHIYCKMDSQNLPQMNIRYDIAEELIEEGDPERLMEYTCIDYDDPENDYDDFGQFIYR